MSEVPRFGSPEKNVEYAERRAAYVVIISDGKVATVKFGQKYFLPGGGSLAGEAPEDTIFREVEEELARSVRLMRRIGEATQYFYSTADHQHYEMRAVFFVAEFTDDSCSGAGEHELFWLPAAEVGRECFHESHAWAVQHA